MCVSERTHDGLDGVDGSPSLPGVFVAVLIVSGCMLEDGERRSTNAVSSVSPRSRCRRCQKGGRLQIVSQPENDDDDETADRWDATSA